MRKILITFALIVLTTGRLHAGQSIITEGEGYACMGDDKSRKVTETAAMAHAKRNATEAASTYLQSETHIKDSMLEKDLLSAYASAQVKVLQEMLKEWYKEQNLGDCYRVKLKFEVIPDEKVLSANAKKSQVAIADDPAAPLNVKIWTDKKEYNQGQLVKVYLKANKPFYGRVVYKDADGKMVQLLPNPYRNDNYFNGGVVYELPGNGDRYDLQVSPPFGSEGVTVYASTSPLGDIETSATGSVYEIKSKPQDVAIGTRGIKLTSKGSGSIYSPSTAEFAEAAAEVTTAK